MELWDSAATGVEIERPSTSQYKSAVWEYFGFMVVYENGVRKVNKEKTVCRECRAVINYTGSTTNMSTHVKRQHPSLKMDT